MQKAIEKIRYISERNCILEIPITGEISHGSLRSREGKDPSECVAASVSKSAQETLESSTLNDKHRLGFRRVLVFAARI